MSVKEYYFTIRGFRIESSHPRNEVLEAFNEACASLQEKASDLEKNVLNPGFVRTLLARGFNPGSDLDSDFADTYWMDDCHVRINDYDRAKICLFLAGTKLMDFVYRVDREEV